MSGGKDASNLLNLTELVSTSSSTTVYPSEDSLVAVLQARFRADIPFTRLGETSLVVVNPLKSLANVNDISAKEYEDRSYKDTTPSNLRPLQPHIYDLAARMYLLMRRRNESQGVIFRGITGSGKSFNSRLLVSQLLRLSAHSKKEAKLASQIKALTPLLESFGHAKALMTSSSSRHSRYLELHFNDRGRIASAKILTFGLDKSRLTRLTHEERSFHVFYQLLAGATPEERDEFNLEDPSEYALLATSGCYRLPGGPFSDDAIAMDELRAAMKTLGFKPKHSHAIFSLLVAILLLGNIQFVDGLSQEQSARILNLEVLDNVAHLLGVSSEDLAQSLTNKTNYVRKEVYTVFLSATQAAEQRDSLTRNLYAILFAFIVETANHRIAPSSQDPPSPTQVVIFDQPGFQSRAPTGGSMSLLSPSPLISAQGQNSFDEFCINFQNELVHSYAIRNTFEDNVGFNAYLTSDGISPPVVATMDNAGCIELLRGPHFSGLQRKPEGMLGIMGKAASSFKQGKSNDKKDEQLVQELVAKCGVHASFASAPINGSERTVFGVNHYSGSCYYDATKFVERDADLLDSAFVSMLRNSSQSFVAKLVSGPSLAAETHSKDPSVVVQAQVLVRPLRTRTPILLADGTSPPPIEEILSEGKTYPVTTQINATMSDLLTALDRTFLWTVSCIRPNDSGSPNSFDKRRVKSQVRSLLLPDMITRRKIEFVVDHELDAFCERYVPNSSGSVMQRISRCAEFHGWQEGVDYVVGHRMIWLAYGPWKAVEDPLRAQEKELKKGTPEALEEEQSYEPDDATTEQQHDVQAYRVRQYEESQDNLLLHRTGTGGTGYNDPNSATPYGNMPTPQTQAGFLEPDGASGWGSEWDHKRPPPDKSPLSKEIPKDLVTKEVNTVEEVPTTRSRRIWVIFVWMMTWWIPSPFLSWCGRMKRADIRMAWREKVTICMLIFLFCGLVIFYIIFFGKLICPEFDHAWSPDEVAGHTDDNSFWVSVQGNVYDISNFWKSDHSKPPFPPASQQFTKALGGKDLTQYFVPPLTLACPVLVSDPLIKLTSPNVTIEVPQAIHLSGNQQPLAGTRLSLADWYTARFQVVMQDYLKGPLVYDPKQIRAQADDIDQGRKWAIIDDKVYDLNDYIYSVKINQGATGFAFLDTSITDLFKQQPGQDISTGFHKAMSSLDPNVQKLNMDCLNHMFYVGRTDFRTTPRCLVPNYLLLAFACLLALTVLVKFLAALQLTGKRNPEMLDKFVICQIPCYTEGEESLRRTIDSLAALKYDDKRKLLFIICDGNIIGSGNERPTPRIVLDILGVDPKLDPEPLRFRSIGEGMKQLNYGKVYSGLYEFEGHVVPYMVIVKVGKPSERPKPGNRGKRDSQVLLLHYLNRVHFDAPMSPLELEIYHQMRNVIGIDPAFYEYVFMVDADTSVTPDSLNRLVSCTSDDSSIIAICGETKLDNEEGSWWTMIQVYEYYISHHLSKAFESLFGSVTCLPGCFSMYRIRTSDKGRPLIISSRVIEDYSECNVDTLHKKNLLSLGEDRYLTTIMMKHFPTFRMKFTPDAIAHTVAPDKFSILLSQRRRWINSTIHNLAELVTLPELCGFCCFSLRFIVFIDLLGTIILPATVVYLVYLIVIVSTGHAPLPLIAIGMIAGVYGLQAIIFLLKREFMLIGWMIIYLIAFPIYSFFLPLYAFWCMDDFSWGNTRMVVGEGSSRKVLNQDDEKFDESMVPLKKFSEYEAEAWETGSRHSGDSRAPSRDQSRAPSRNQSRAPSRNQSHAPTHSPSHAPSHYHGSVSQAGDFYRETNLTMNSSSNPNIRLRSQGSHGNLSQYGSNSPQVPFMPLGGGPGSAYAGSEYGGAPSVNMGMLPPMAFPPGPGSMYGMPAPRNSVMTNLNMFGGGLGGTGPSSFAPLGAHGRPISTFSMATSVNPFAGPSMSTEPTDDELLAVLRYYLSTQDLMTVTKKTAREAVMARFPKADLTGRKDFLNESIDRILSES